MGRRPSPRTRKRSKPREAPAAADDTPAANFPEDELPTETDVVRDGFILDFISGTKEVKETPKELVRQRIARALFHEYGISVEDMTADYLIFMAVAERDGFDCRGNSLCRRSPEGEEITRDVEQVQTITVGGRKVARTLRRKERIPDHDRPEIAKRCWAIRRHHPEPPP